MSSFSAHMDCECHAKHVECSESTQKARTRDASSQTNVRLPHTQHDIIWTASHLRPMIDEDEGDAARDESDTNEDGPMSESVTRGVRQIVGDPQPVNVYSRSSVTARREGASSHEEIKEGSSVDDIDILGEDEGSSLSMVPMASQETEQESARS